MSEAAGLVAGLPPGTTGLARALLGVADRRLWALTGRRVVLDDADVVDLLGAPRLLDAAWPAPTAPLEVPGGAVHADVTDDDAATFDLLRRTVPDAGPEELSAAAQGWRLPVTPYRQPGQPVQPGAPGQPGQPTHPSFAPEAGLGPAVDPPAPPQPWTDGLARTRVLDLTSLWAGPLCTSMLATHGAHVTKVDPDCRPDGFRSRPALYRRLNGGKQVVDLDLRLPAGRARFEELVRRSDLVVHSFSRRVMPNLGYGPSELQALNPDVATLAITAFPDACDERDWLSYGSGVHAISGLGMLDGGPTPAPIAYPDPLAGVAAFALALSLLGRHDGEARPPRHAEASLAGVVAPLVPAAAAAGVRV